MGWDYGARWEHGEHDHSYTCAELWCRPELRDSEFIAATRSKRLRSVGQGLVGRVLESGAPSWIADIAADPGLGRAPAALRCGLTGAFAFPIATGNRTLGAMEFFAQRVWPPDFALTDTARAVGRQIAQFMVRKQAEERFRELVELSPNAILVHCDGNIVFANTATSLLLGATHSSDLLGRSVYDFLHPEHRELARERVGRIVQHRLMLGAMEMKYVRMDGSTGHMEVSSSYFLYEGRPAVQAIARDISERKAAEQKIIRLSNLYAALSQTNRAITRRTDPQNLFEEVCRIAAQYGNFELATILMIEPQSQWVRPAATAGVYHDYIHTVRISADPDIPEGQGLTGTALRSGQPVICNDVTLDARTLPWRDALLGRGLHALANIPLRRRGEVVGTCSCRSSEVGFFDAAAGASCWSRCRPTYPSRSMRWTARRNAVRPRSASPCSRSTMC